MKISSPKVMAWVISAIASGVSGLVIIIVPNRLLASEHLFALAAMFSIFVVMYFVVHKLISRFLFERINPIYKTIYSLNFPEKKLKRDLDNKDIIGDVNRDVISWATQKSEEIHKLKELENYRKEFLGNVSHELKTPIFNIQGYVLTLLDGALNDPSINKKYLERTEKSIERLISVVDDLEAISKLESKVLKLAMEKINIVQLVNDIYEAQEFRAKKRNIKLSIGGDYNEPIWVFADRKRIGQALTNLIVNSINYGKEGGKTKVSFMDMNESILIEVNDNGIGIPKEDVPRIFERFYRVDKSRSREQGGTGLGLAIVKHIVEAHNQTINVRSSLNEGTSFVFTLKKFTYL